MPAMWGAQGFGMKSGIVQGRGGALRVLTVHPDSPQAASGGVPGTGNRKSHCSPLLDMGFGPVWQSPTLSPRRTTVGAEGRELEGIRGCPAQRHSPNTQVHGCTHTYVHSIHSYLCGAPPLFRDTLAHVHMHRANFCA